MPKLHKNIFANSIYNVAPDGAVLDRRNARQLYRSAVSLALHKYNIQK